MNQNRIGVNMEFVRHADKSFEFGAQRAAELGYRYIEPCFLMARACSVRRATATSNRSTWTRSTSRISASGTA